MSSNTGAWLLQSAPGLAQALNRLVREGVTTIDEIRGVTGS